MIKGKMRNFSRKEKGQFFAAFRLKITLMWIKIIQFFKKQIYNVK